MELEKAKLHVQRSGVTRQDILSMEKEISEIPGAEVLGFGQESDRAPVLHGFAPGLYLRKMLIPKGTILVSKIHRHEHFSFLMQGDITVISETGGIQRLKAPQIILSKPGAKRIGFAHADTVWVTAHPTEETDLEKIEELTIAPSYAEFEKSRKDFIEIKADEENMEKLIEVVVSENFDVELFRELTKKIIAAEKDGFWSDFTKEQQDAYTARDWETFSRLRGYSEEEIEDFRTWLAGIEVADSVGLNALTFIADLAEEAFQKNLKKDVKGEIKLTSHSPLEFIKKKAGA